jgi:predicted phage tail protein
VLDFLLPAAFLAICACGLIFGLRALSRHGKAATLTTIGWGLFLLHHLFFFFLWGFFNYDTRIQLLMNFLLYPGAIIMILLGILSMLTPRASNPVTTGMPGNSASAFQYQGLDLHAEGDQS